MDMELAYGAVASLPKVIFYKIKYGRRFQAPLVHALGKHFSIVIKKSGQLSVGKELVTRANCHIRVEKGKLTIGDKCFFNLNGSITCMEEIVIGDGCQIGNNVVIVDHNHTRDFSGYTTKPVKIGNKVWIGANCVILPGTVIGDNVVIGAGSLVMGEIPAGCTYYNKRQKELVRENDNGNCSGIQ